MEPTVGNEGMVTFDIQLPPNTQTRAFAQASFNKTLYYAAYETGSTTPACSESIDMQEALTTKITMQLVNGKTYDFIFWADCGENSPYTFFPESQNVTVDYSAAVANDDTRDAFFQTKKGITISGHMKDNVYLRRPFAQINVGTNDVEIARKAGVEVETTSLTVTGAYSVLDLYTGISSELTADPVVFSGAAPALTETFPTSHADNAYTYLAMAYVLTGIEVGEDVQQAQSELFKVDATITCNGGHTITVPVDNAPVQRNYRTNIYGSLLTSPFDWDVEIIPDFNTLDYNLTDEVKEPAQAESGEYLITTQGELAWLANYVKEGGSTSGKTYSLQNDIYLIGKFTPIGGGGLSFDYRFSGKFLGNGHTIYNMEIDASERAGFFGFINGTVEDLNFDNANVTSNHWAGVVAGFSDNETGSCYIKNCKVTNSSVTLTAENLGSEWDNGDKAGGIIGFMATKDQVTNCVVENVTIRGYRDLGGIIGYSSGSVITGNTVKGLTILVDNSHNYKSYTTLGNGGNDANPIIGENNGGTDSGNVSSEVTIMEYVAPGLGYDESSNTYLVDSAEGLIALSSKTIGKNQKVELSADIDLKGQTIPMLRAWNPENPNTFDGNGHTISNVSLTNRNYSIINEWVGPIRNVTFEGVIGEGISQRICGLFANVYGDIENVHVKNMKFISSEGRVGGIVGIHNAGVLRNCSVENMEISGGWSVGGMIGCINETPKEDCYENLTVKNVKVTNTHLLGGIYDKLTGVLVGDLNIEGVEFKNCKIEDCDTDLPLYNTYKDYIWNGQTIKQDLFD